MSLIAGGKKEAFLNMFSKNVFELVGGPGCPDFYNYGSFYSRL